MSSQQPPNNYGLPGYLTGDGPGDGIWGNFNRFERRQPGWPSSSTNPPGAARSDSYGCNPELGQETNNALRGPSTTPYDPTTQVLTANVSADHTTNSTPVQAVSSLNLILHAMLRGENEDCAQIDQTSFTEAEIAKTASILCTAFETQLSNLLPKARFRDPGINPSLGLKAKYVLSQAAEHVLLAAHQFSSYNDRPGTDYARRYQEICSTEGKEAAERFAVRTASNALNVGVQYRGPSGIKGNKSLTQGYSSTVRDCLSQIRSKFNNDLSGLGKDGSYLEVPEFPAMNKELPDHQDESLDYSHWEPWFDLWSGNTRRVSLGTRYHGGQ